MLAVLGLFFLGLPLTLGQGPTDPSAFGFRKIQRRDRDIGMMSNVNIYGNELITSVSIAKYFGFLICLQRELYKYKDLFLYAKSYCDGPTLTNRLKHA